MSPRSLDSIPNFPGPLLPLIVLFLGVGLGCESAYPEVVVVNKLGEEILVKDVSFNGCLWTGVLAHEETTSPGHCLSGSDRVHFKKFDVAAQYSEADAGVDEGDGGVEPNWFNYQTLTTHNVDHGDFLVVELTPGDLEQDFSVPGPYGH